MSTGNLHENRHREEQTYRSYEITKLSERDLRDELTYMRDAWPTEGFRDYVWRRICWRFHLHEANRRGITEFNGVNMFASQKDAT